MKPTKRTSIALNLPTVIALLIVLVRHVVQAMTSSAWFAGAAALLAKTTTDVDDLQAKEVTAKSKAKGTAADRDLQKKVVEDDMAAIKALVQGVVNQNPADKAIAIIQSAGLSPKLFTARQKPELGALMGATQEEVRLRAKAVARRAAYEWQYSVDGGKTWITIGITTTANTSVFGIAVGTTCLFRFRATVKNVTGDWSQVISFLVH